MYAYITAYENAKDVYYYILVFKKIRIIVPGNYQNHLRVSL